jgi:hypothetical protein
VFKRLRGASIKRPSWQRALYTRKRNNDTVFTCFFEVGRGCFRSKSSWRKGGSLRERRGSRFAVSFTEDCPSGRVSLQLRGSRHLKEQRAHPALLKQARPADRLQNLRYARCLLADPREFDK